MSNLDHLDLPFVSRLGLNQVWLQVCLVTNARALRMLRMANLPSMHLRVNARIKVSSYTGTFATGYAP
ncbi:hypothetical protein GKC28_20795 [Leisingera sp. ANG59]|nr:hypothetical protein [Leisingera sp. ANG59]